jgi:hypothetical protein
MNNECRWISKFASQPDIDFIANFETTTLGRLAKAQGHAVAFADRIILAVVEFRIVA